MKYEVIFKISMLQFETECFGKWEVHNCRSFEPFWEMPPQITMMYWSSSSSSSYIYHGVGPLVDPFRSHVSRSLFKGLPWFLLPVGESYFNTLGNLFRGILFTCCIQLLLYSSNLSKTGVIFKHAGPEAKGSNPTTGLTLLWAHKPFRGNFNHWQVSRKELGYLRLQTHTQVA